MTRFVGAGMHQGSLGGGSAVLAAPPEVLTKAGAPTPGPWLGDPTPAHDTRNGHAAADRIDREKLYSDFQPLVRRLMRQYGQDPELQQELPGEIFYRFCLLLDAFDPERGVPLRPYLVRTLTASVYTFARRHWQRQSREVQVESNVEWREPTELWDPTRQWDQAIDRRDLLQQLPDAIAHLPLRQRQTVALRFYEGRSFEEIAETMGVRPATVRSLVRHGLNNLRRILAVPDQARD